MERILNDIYHVLYNMYYICMKVDKFKRRGML